MRTSPLPRLAAVLLVVVACTEPDPVAPTPAQTQPLAARNCALGLADADAVTLVNELIAKVNALETSGALSSGEASALRSHLASILQSIAAGQYCAAAAQLQAFLRLVENYVRGGVLTEEQGDTLSDDASDVLEGPKDELSFLTNRDGNYEIYLVKSDGSDLRNLTNNNESDGRLGYGWSPDGSKIVSASWREGVLGLFTMNADGSGLTRLTNDARGDTDPVWSPDGQRIAFRRGRDTGPTTTELWVMNADASNQVRLTDNTVFDIADDWSPDGTRLVFRRGPAFSDQDIYVINRDGSGERWVARSPALVGSAARWSPDGTRIVFTSVHDRNTEVYTVNPDGSGTTRLTTSPASPSPVLNIEPEWSPDGSMLAFSRCTSGLDLQCQVYTIKSDGTGETNVSNDASVSEIGAVWSPDGTRLAFTRIISASPFLRDIYLMNRDGTGKRSLTTNTADDFSIAWRPR